VPDAPTHAARLAARRAAEAEATPAATTDDEAEAGARPAQPAVDRWTGTRAEDANVPVGR
jgi:hypothetical protein